MSDTPPDPMPGPKPDSKPGKALDTPLSGAASATPPAPRPLPWHATWRLPAAIMAAAAAPIAWFQFVWNEDPGLTNSVTMGTAAGAVLALIVWTALQSRWPWTVRLAPAVLVVAAFAATASFYKVEFTGGMDLLLVSRWQFWSLPTVAAGGALRPADGAPQDPAAARIRDYPQFLGPRRDATLANVRLETDWNARPPRQLWRQPIGEGWSAFAVVGRRAVTQEQRGEQETVVCYDLLTGEVLWIHEDRARFSEVLGGVGPRATPTIHEGSVYTLGATGILNCLDLAEGGRRWSRDILADNEAENVQWGKSGSPLVIGDRVIVSAGGKLGSLVAYHRHTGEVIWRGGSRVSAYGSPVWATLEGVEQILIVNEHYLTSHDAADGRVLWEYPWRGSSGSNASCSQPVPLEKTSQVFLSKGYGEGSVLLDVARAGGGSDAGDAGDSSDGRWTVSEAWRNPRVMRTKFSNVVIRDGYVYGLDENILQCIELATGESVWKVGAGRYGWGQLMLVGDVLLIVTETAGDAVLVRATPEGHHELARHEVIEGGRTWNNPALAGPYLLVRNSRWAACFELPLTAAGD